MGLRARMLGTTHRGEAVGFLNGQVRSEATETASEAGGRKKSREILAIAGGIVITIAVLSVVPLALEYLRDTAPQETKVDELIREARAGAWDKAYGCTTEDFQQAVPLDVFQSALESLPGFDTDGTHDLRWNGEHSERLGMVNATLHSADGLEMATSFTVYRGVLGEDWLVADVEVDGLSLFESALYR